MYLNLQILHSTLYMVFLRKQIFPFESLQILHDESQIFFSLGGLNMESRELVV